MPEVRPQLYRYPVLMITDREGIITGLVAGCPWIGIGAVGTSPDDVLTQMRTLIRQVPEEHPGSPWIAEAKLTVVSVSVRPRVVEKRRTIPSQGLVSVRIACVHGPSETGEISCDLPQLGLSLDLAEEKELREVVSAMVRTILEAQSPELALRLSHAADFGLAELRARPPVPKDTESDLSVVAPELLKVARAIPSRGLRPPATAGLGREALVVELVSRLVESRSSAVLVGPVGAGKTALLLEAAVKAEAHLPRAVDGPRGPRFWWTSGARLVSGMLFLGEWQERCDRVVAELRGLGGVLCVDSLMGLVRAAGESPDAGLGAYLRDYLARGELRLLTEATPEEFEACRRQLPGLAAALERFTVPALDRPSVLQVFERLLRDRSSATGRAVQPGVAERVHGLFARFRPYEALPGSAAGFLSRLFERAAPGETARLPVGPEVAVQAFARETGLPDPILRDELPLDPAATLDWFRNRVVGQEEACRAAARLVTAFKAGVNDPRRPLATLLFAGPTGVGKTEMAKALAEYFFGNGERAAERFVRLDMSEYSGPDAAWRLLGDPFGHPGALVTRVRRDPFSVVLLDEIEKASEDVFDIILTLLDEGRMTDAFGRVTRFHSSVVVMTSNLGGELGDSLGFARDSVPDYEAEVRGHFRPEFFNRLDRVVRFLPLGADTMAAIVRKELAGLGRREGPTRRGLRLEFSEELVGHLATRGFDRRYGARPLQRIIEDAVAAPLGRWLTAHARIGDRTLRIGLGADGKASVETTAEGQHGSDGIGLHDGPPNG